MGVNNISVGLLTLVIRSNKRITKSKSIRKVIKINKNIYKIKNKKGDAIAVKGRTVGERQEAASLFFKFQNTLNRIMTYGIFILIIIQNKETKVNQNKK